MNTWGISGPSFLLIYIGLGAVMAGVLRLRYGRLVKLPAGATGLERQELGHCELALLKDGPRFAVAVAACSLHHAGSVAPGDSDTTLVVAGPLPSGAHPLEAAIYESLRDPGQRPAKEVLEGVAQGPEIASMHERLEMLGLVPTAANVDRFREERVALAGALVILGVARIVAGAVNHRPVGFLVALTVVTAILAAMVPPEVPSRRTSRRRSRCRERSSACGRGASPPSRTG
jgi:uncharacterized protein (TIGR04222 family)